MIKKVDKLNMVMIAVIWITVKKKKKLKLGWLYETCKWWHTDGENY